MAPQKGAKRVVSQSSQKDPEKIPHTRLKQLIGCAEQLLGEARPWASAALRILNRLGKLRTSLDT